MEERIKEHEDPERQELHIPMRDSEEGPKEYKVEYLYSDQKAIVAEVCTKLKEFMEMEDLRKFKPLRMTVNGGGGAGKSVVINTIVTIFRKMFNYNNVVKVAAPSGCAAFNVKGETFHHLMELKVSSSTYKPGSMSQDKRDRLLAKFKVLLCLLIDERSLVNSKELGATNQMISETLYGGHFADHQDFGGLPFVILFGDDYQLPSCGAGAFDAIQNTQTDKMIALGASTFLKCGRKVMNLKSNRRMGDDMKEDKFLLETIRKQKEPTKKQVQKLLNLHIETFGNNFGTAKKREIQQKAIYLSYTNNKRKAHNIKKLAMLSSPTNPVAILKPQNWGVTRGKAESTHFGQNNKPPPSALLFKGAIVAINNKNFCPIWGLHNGACGKVQEIVFAKEHNPNHGDLPRYVVVDFPLYTGPAWDVINKTVSSIITNHLKLLISSLFLTTIQACPHTNGIILLQQIPKWPMLQKNLYTSMPGICKNNPQIPRTISRTSGQRQNPEHV